jgi:ferredoxin-NADP reductase
MNLFSSLVPRTRMLTNSRLERFGRTTGSSPLDTLWTEQRYLELSIKKSDQVVVSWVHDACQVGDTCRVRVGGNCIFDPRRHLLVPDGTPFRASASALFIAGGVGITPLISMIRHVNASTALSGMPSSLLYSAKNPHELVYRSLLGQLPPTKCQFFCTAAADGVAGEDAVHNRRIQPSDLAAALGPHTQSTFVYVCGPNAFLDDMVAALKALGCPSAHILFEKWW